MTYYDQTTDAVLQQLNTDRTAGLSEKEVAQRREQYGENRLREKKKKTNAQRFADQFKDAMILILIAAAVISFVVACVQGEPGEFFEPVLILLIVLLNATMGVLQESKAEKALEALQGLSAPHARVLRGGAGQAIKEEMVDAVALVPGDVIKLEAGDFVPADARLLHSTNLKSEESALTGESVPAEKDADAVLKAGAALGERANMVFSGCSITYGTALAVVTATGMDTEMGKIANLLDNEQEGQTPLQAKLAQLGKYLGALALVACAIVFVIGVLNSIPPLEIFMTAVSLAVSAIPEGLPAIVTIVLSIGVQRMVKKNAIIRRLPAVETLGGASVICSDKTGTLTQNRMTLVKAYLDGAAAPVDITPDCDPETRYLLALGALCCDGAVVFGGGDESGNGAAGSEGANGKKAEKITVQHIGDPTETAIVLAAHQNGMPKEQLNADAPRLAELPFDSDRKLMTTVNRWQGKNLVIVKGAFDMLAPRCVAGDLAAAEKMNEQMSASALRVLAVACKEVDTVPAQPTSAELEAGLTFVGLVGMIDPPRQEAKDAVATCRVAGIRPVMITGDHVVTASAIARELGILQPGDKAITGAELDAMTDRELDETVEKISVYARVSPENKIRIVKAWQRNNQVVAMTGDGVNDAPALKAADIGCAMGITGTDVAKGAADMTLTDDNFATIVDAVREGRGIYENIKKVVGFLLGTNIGEVITVFVAMLIWHQTPLLSMHLLMINLVTDSLPAIALGMEPVEQGIMARKPKPKAEGLFAHGFGLRIVLQGVMFGILSLVAFYVGRTATGQIAGGQTLTFLVLAFSQVVQAFNMRSERSLFAIGVFSNPKLNMAALTSTVLLLLVLFTPLAIPFELVRLSAPLYLAGLGLSLVPLGVMEFSKAFGLIKHHH